MNILIFGATSGIGKELAKLLVNDNHTVVITGRRLEKLQEIKNSNPEKYIIRQHDVTDLNSSDTLFDEILKELKTIDLIVYSSGVGEANYQLEWEKELPTLETNVMGATKIFGLAYQLFHKQGYGHLVAISSIAAIRGNRHVPAYFASKAFQKNYLESLWLKGQKSKAEIYVTDIIPGFVDTAMAKGATFWMADSQKATKQIYQAIKKKKKRAYITKRWRLVAIFLRILPARLLLKM
jgi:short-subunit dehydrogenase